MKIQSTLFNLAALLTLLSVSDSAGQCPTSSFSINSPVCAGTPLQINNNSIGGISYKWDFSPGFFSKPAVLIADTTLNLNYPGDITLVNDNDTNYIFLCGLANGNLYRLTYGNGPGKPLTQVDNFGTLASFYQPSDIALYKEGGNWYGLLVDYGNNYLFRISFGNSLKNNPISVTPVLNNTVSNFTNPWSIKLNTDSTGNIFGFVCNHTGGSITILNFGNSILNTPVANAAIPVPGTTYCQDAAVVNSCGNWYAFLAGNGSTKIIRAEFGNSLLNSPVFTTIINDGSPSDILLVNDSTHWKLLYTNFFSYETKKYDIGSDLANITPVYLGSDRFNGSNPKGICTARQNDTTFVYLLFSSNNVQTIAYTNNTPVNQALSNDSVPQNISFSQAGDYPVTLTVTGSNGNSISSTQMVSIKTSPQTNFNFSSQCYGDNTTFTDSSLVSSGFINSWKWDFGDGDSAAVPNPTHTYSLAGNYPVRLVTSSSFGCTDTLIRQVRISSLPQAAFTYPPAVCSLTDIGFTDQSTVNNDTINQWTWSFGNGDSSTIQNPVYSFPAGGTYEVSLVVTSQSGCKDTLTDTLVFSDRPQAGFSTSNTCVGQNVQFTDETILSNASISNYQWDFGDGASDTTANPQHMYAGSVATYTARLIVIAANGCKDTLLQSVKINNVPVVGFSFSPLSGCENNDVYFTDLSTVSGDTISGWYWDFGDNSYDSVANPVHRYTQSGQYTITLIASSPSHCPGTAFQQVIDIKESPIAAFNYSTTCDGSPMHFINNSTPVAGSTIDSVSWNFAGISTSGIYEPDFQFPNSGNYNVILNVVSSDGCIGVDSMNVLVHANPFSDFSNTLPCTGDTIQFTNQSTSDINSSITQYVWNFGDPASGLNNSSALQNPSHKYDTNQVFLVSLITTTNFGCKDTLIKNLAINPSPGAQFTYTPTCKGSIMSFINPGGPLDSIYHWDFGDSQTNLIKEPAHYYVNDGQYTVTLTVTSSAGCSTTAVQIVNVNPIPVAHFLPLPACVNNSYTFLDSSSIASGNIINWSWSIPGLADPESVQFPNYFFTDTGTYNVSLSVTSDAGCSNSTTKSVTVHGIPVSNFSFDPQFGNPPLNVQFTNSSLGGNSYSWDFGDGSASSYLENPSHLFTDTGRFVITQYITSLYGCKDSIQKNIYVIKPVLDIAVTGDSSYFDDSYFHIVCKLKNLGTREINNLILEAQLENGNTIQEQMTDLLPNGTLGYKTYYFHASFLINSASLFNYYCIRALNPNNEEDDNPENNERCVNLTENTLVMEPYPNPFTDIFHLRLLINHADQLNIELLDVSGRKVGELYNGKADKNLLDIKADLSGLNDGIYFARIIYRDKLIVRKVIKGKLK